MSNKNINYFTFNTNKYYLSIPNSNHNNLLLYLPSDNDIMYFEKKSISNSFDLNIVVGCITL